MKSDSTSEKSCASKGTRPLRSTEMETTDPDGNKNVVTETLFEDGSSVKEEKTFKNDKLIFEKSTKTLPKVSQRRYAPATKTLPVDELLTSSSEVRRLTGNNQNNATIDEEPTKSDHQDKKKPSRDTLSSNIAPNTDLEQGSNTISDAYNSNIAPVPDISETQVPPPFHPEIVEAFVVANEDQEDSTIPKPEKREPLKALKSKFLTEDRKFKKKIWLMLVVIVLLIAVVGISVGVTSSKSSAQTNQTNQTTEPTQQITMAPTENPTLSPSLKPTVLTKCTELCLEEISETECPSVSELRDLLPCDKINIGELCDADGECGTDATTNNCNDFDVYRRVICKIDKPWAVGVSGNGFEYYVETKKMDWFSHARNAALNDAYLVSIHSHQERIFVVNQMRRNDITKAFTGGIRKGVKNDPLNKVGNNGTYWRWSDNTPWDYYVWNDNEPNHNDTNSLLVETAVDLDLRMNDVPPTNEQGAVYKRVTSRDPSTYTYTLPQSLGTYASCVTNNQMELFCMGRASLGRLGVGVDINSRININVPTFVNFTDHKKVKSVGMGLYHGCAILDNGSLECWGYNYYGQIGIGNSITQIEPKRIYFSSNKTATQISLGYYHTCALLNDNALKCWGRNNHKQLGSGSTQFRESTPQDVNISPGRTVKQVACGSYHTCAVLDNGDLTCWGSNSYGQLGDGTNQTSLTGSPVNVALDKKVKMVSLGVDSTCVILEDNSLKCWGGNLDGQLGIGTSVDQWSPTDVNIDNNKAIKHISASASGFHRCAILNDNRLFCWGRNYGGQLGRGNYNTGKDPLQVNLNGKLVKQVSVGFSHTCVVLFDESLKCWGSNWYGQLGYSKYLYYNDGRTVDSLKI